MDPDLPLAAVPEDKTKSPELPVPAVPDDRVNAPVLPVVVAPADNVNDPVLPMTAVPDDKVKSPEFPWTKDLPDESVTHLSRRWLKAPMEGASWRTLVCPGRNELWKTVRVVGDDARKH